MSAQPEAVELKQHHVVESEEFRRALEIAGRYATDVDRESRFPSEAIEALRVAEALGWFVPGELGGAGAPIDTLACVAFELARRCSATGMIFAMHQIQVACLVRHHGGSPWIEDYLRRLVREQRLIASATSEAGVGGEIRRSIAALRGAEAGSPGRLQFEKQAPTVSYGAHADDLLTTVRSCPEADEGDQVLVLTPLSEVEMKQTGDWDVLGMRGTCSPGFQIRATCGSEQVLPVEFGVIAAETMVPISHILWAHVWLGVATEAFYRAQKFVRDQARRNPKVRPPSAVRLSELSAVMAMFRALVQAGLQEYMSIADGGRSVLSTIGYATRVNNLKIAASEAAVDACARALRICGVAGYQNGGPYSVGRQLRDAHSAALMIANDRLHATNAALLLMHQEAK